MNESATEVVCGFCKRAQSEWRANQGLAYVTDGKEAFCCEGCARKENCRCTILQTAPRLASHVDKTVGSENK